METHHTACPTDDGILDFFYKKVLLRVIIYRKSQILSRDDRAKRSYDLIVESAMPGP